MLVELLVNKSGDTSQIIIKGSISRPIPTVCGHRFPGNQQQIGAESTVGALSIRKRYVYTQLGLEMIRCRTTLQSYRLSQVYCDPTREEVADVIDLNQPIDVIVTCTVTAVVPTLTVPICRYVLERCVVLCGLGDCLFVRSHHDDKIMPGQRTVYYKMTSAKTHDWSTDRTIQQRLHRR